PSGVSFKSDALISSVERRRGLVRGRMYSQEMIELTTAATNAIVANRPLVMAYLRRQRAPLPRQYTSPNTLAPSIRFTVTSLSGYSVSYADHTSNLNVPRLARGSRHPSDRRGTSAARGTSCLHAGRAADAPRG